MNDLIENLVKALDGAVQLYEKLRIVLERKRAAIVQGKTDELNHCSATEERLMELAQVLNDNRVGIMGSLAHRVGLRGADISLQNVAERLGEPWASKLMGMKDRLSALVHKVQEINRLNAMLIKDSLEFIGDVLRRTFSRQPNAALVYGQTGTVNPVTVESRLVNLNA